MIQGCEALSDHPALPALGPVAYLTGEYPKVSHTFIQREIAALRDLGLTIEACTIRRAPAKDVVGPAQLAEQARTFCVIGAAKSPARLLGAHLRLLRRSPKRWISALKLALKTRPAGIKALAWQGFYFLEAGVLADHLLRRSVVHLHNHFGNSSCSVSMIASEISGIPYSYTAHGPSEFFEPHYWRIDQKCARAAFVSAISHYARAQCMIFTPQAHWDRIRIVHCGVIPALYGQPANPDAANPDAPDAARQASAPLSGPEIVFVGRLAAVKGVAVLIEAMAGLRARHPGARLTLVGDGGERQALEAKVRAADLEGMVHFAGYQDQEGVAAILARADIFALPSFAEGVPVVLMEAMASRLPVIATRVAGVPELVEDGVSGFVVPPGDLDSLMQSLDRLLQDPDLRARMGAAGRAKVMADYDVTAEARWLAQLFAGVQAGALPQGLRP